MVYWIFWPGILVLVLEWKGAGEKTRGSDCMNEMKGKISAMNLGIQTSEDDGHTKIPSMLMSIIIIHWHDYLLVIFSKVPILIIWLLVKMIIKLKITLNRFEAQTLKVWQSSSHKTSWLLLRMNINWDDSSLFNLKAKIQPNQVMRWLAIFSIFYLIPAMITPRVTLT